MTPAPATKHQITLGNLHRILSTYVFANHIGRLLLAPTDVILAATTVVQPDLVFVGNDRSQVVTSRGVEGSPTLVVEILSPTTERTDRQTKAQLYAKHGVLHYWLIDPDQQTLEAYELAGDQYKLVGKAQSAEVFTPSLFAGLSIQLADLWL